MIVPVILAGGSGTRLWPLSRELYPKQLLNLTDQNTMLQNTMLRLSNLPDMGDPVVVCNEEHRFMVAEQLQAIGVKSASILLEPVGRNTAPAIAVAALQILSAGIDPIMLVLPADHVIRNIDKFLKALEHGVRYAQKDSLITFGIIPESPETGYGYIQKGDRLDPAASTIAKFVEKPDLSTARKYLESGNFCWNSGMFMFKASVIIGQLERFAPDIVSACRTALENSREDLDFIRLNRDAFASCPSDSIDYAVMEKTGAGVVVPVDAGWTDLGSWDSLWHAGVRDENQNVILGDVLTHATHNSYFNSESRLIAAVGVDNLIVVETRDAVLVASRDKVQDVKQIVGMLRKQGRSETSSHKRVYRPWGSYETVDISHRFQVKRITVKPGAKLSLQKHFHRAEHWTVVSGTALVTQDDKEILLKEDQSTYIPLGVTHRIENPGKIPLELIEVQSGSYLGEDDIVRFEDVYGR
ncbi:MAG: mannose-1-phosphate guanylyltransferase/mannose-6-phosphate isomerase [Pseudomonadota bacterium]